MSSTVKKHREKGEKRSNRGDKSSGSKDSEEDKQSRNEDKSRASKDSTSKASTSKLSEHSSTRKKRKKTSKKRKDRPSLSEVEVSTASKENPSEDQYSGSSPGKEASTSATSESPKISTPPREGSKSPEAACSICLGKVENKSFTDSCFHEFCFVCLLEWSKIKAVCPLCKQPFKSIIHNVRSIEDYDQYHLRSDENGSLDSPDGNRFRYRTTMTTDRWMMRQHREQLRQLRLLQRPTRVTTRSQWRTNRQAATSAFRHRVYVHSMWVQGEQGNITDSGRPARFREVSTQFFRGNPACTHRLVPWLNRELNVLLNRHEDHVQFVLELILDLVKRFEIQGEEFAEHIRPFTGRRTEHFIHEFYHYARSPFDMVAYDGHAVYNEPEIPVHTIESSSSDSDPDDPDVIILSPSIPGGSRHDTGQEHSYSSSLVNTYYPEPPAERGGFGNVWDLTPLLNRLRVPDFLSVMNTFPTSLSGWDSPTPGPSALMLSPPRATSPTREAAVYMVTSSSFLGPNPPVSSVKEESARKAQNSAGIVNTIDSDSDESEIAIVGYERPLEERTPEIVDVSSTDDDEVIFEREIKKQNRPRKERRAKTPDAYKNCNRSKSRSRSRHRSTSKSRRKSSRSISRSPSHNRHHRRSRSRSHTNLKSRDSRYRSSSHAKESSRSRNRRSRSRSSHRDGHSQTSRNRTRSRSKEGSRYGGKSDRSRHRSRSSSRTRKRSRSVSHHRNHRSHRSRSSSIEVIGVRRGDRYGRRYENDRASKRRRRTRYPSSDEIEVVDSYPPSRYRNRDRNRDRSRDRHRERNRNRSRDRGGERNRHRSRDRSRTRERSKGRSRERSRDRRRGRSRGNTRERSRDRNRHRSRDRSREHRSRERSRERNQKRSRERNRTGSSYQGRDSGRDNSRDRNETRGRIRDRSSSRNRRRNRSSSSSSSRERARVKSHERDDQRSQYKKHHSGHKKSSTQASSGRRVRYTETAEYLEMLQVIKNMKKEKDLEKKKTATLSKVESGGNQVQPSTSNSNPSEKQQEHQSTEARNIPPQQPESSGVSSISASCNVSASDVQVSTVQEAQKLSRLTGARSDDPTLCPGISEESNDNASLFSPDSTVEENRIDDSANASIYNNNNSVSRAPQNVPVLDVDSNLPDLGVPDLSPGAEMGCGQSAPRDTGISAVVKSGTSGEENICDTSLDALGITEDIVSTGADVNAVFSNLCNNSLQLQHASLHDLERSMRENISSRIRNRNVEQFSSSEAAVGSSSDHAGNAENRHVDNNRKRHIYEQEGQKEQIKYQHS